MYPKFRDMDDSESVKLTSSSTVEAKPDIRCHYCMCNLNSQTLGCDESQKKNPQIGGESEKQRE